MVSKERKKCRFQCGDYKCGRPLYKDGYCIFHSKEVEDKKDKFNNAFGKEFERQKKYEKEYDFSGFVFPEDILFKFKEIEFEKKVCFRKAKFCGKIDFCGAKFYKMADFNNTEFCGDANFSLTQFSKFADFGGETKFFGNAYFTGAKFFGYANFGLAQFHGETTFREVKFFKNADFQSIVLKNFDNFLMDYTYFYNIRGLFEFIKKNKKNFRYSNKTEFLPDNFKFILGDEVIARYPIISRKIRDDMFLLRFKEMHKWPFKVWFLFADCGRSFFRWALWCMLIALIFAFVYYNFFYLKNQNLFEAKYISKSWPGFSFIYYSVVTFTTLGFGDIIPKSGWLQFWVMIEVILGYIGLGGLISILANKLARRS